LSKITGFTAFDENHGFLDFRDYLLSLTVCGTFPGAKVSWVTVSAWNLKRYLKFKYRFKS